MFGVMFDCLPFVGDFCADGTEDVGRGDDFKGDTDVRNGDRTGD